MPPVCISLRRCGVLVAIFWEAPLLSAVSTLLCKFFGIFVFNHILSSINLMTRPTFKDFSVNLAEEGPSTSKKILPCDPPGYRNPDAVKELDGPRSSKAEQEKEMKIVKAKQRAAWDFATGQFRSMIPLAFMSYMSGNSLSLWTIMMTYNTVATPVRNILNARKEFERFRDSKGRVDTIIPTIIFVAMWLGALALACVKLDYIGILPKTLLDWVAAMKPARYTEISVPSMKIA